TGQIIDSEPLGGAHLHTAVSGVAHYMADDDADCLVRIRARFRDLPQLLPSGADPLVRAGPPGPACRELSADSPQADEGVGRGPGGPPHSTKHYRGRPHWVPSNFSATGAK